MFIWSYALIGLMGGIIATAAMTLIEIPSWRKWGLHGVFEWHENQILSTRLFNLFSSHNGKKEKETLTCFKGIFFLHFLNGTLAAIAFPFIIYFGFILTGILNAIPILLLGILYGFILWILTLVPIHKPITGFSPWNHPLGHLPALASFGGHLVYGIVLAAIVGILTAY